MSTLFRRRRIVAVLFALVAFAGLILANPASYRDTVPETLFDATSVRKNPDQTVAVSLLAKDVVENLAVREKHRPDADGSKYYRKLFYSDWSRNADGCSMREIILHRDLKDLAMQDHCKVASGTLNDPYTGKTIAFLRGRQTSSAVQIDHVVALSNAWATGAYDDAVFSAEQRNRLSQDPLNLIAVDGTANQQKSDASAADWLPPNEAFRCQYVARQISVKYKYHLWVTPREKAAMLNVLSTCPDEPVVGIELTPAPTPNSP